MKISDQIKPNLHLQRNKVDRNMQSKKKAEDGEFERMNRIECKIGEFERMN
ncbi:hypothetical protein Bca4012_058608 [Brassica carinata]